MQNSLQASFAQNAKFGCEVSKMASDGEALTEDVNVSNANQTKLIKNNKGKTGVLDGTLDYRMMKAESHRLEKLFHEIDTNKDGRIDARELFEGLKRMGYYHISEEQVEV